MFDLNVRELDKTFSLMSWLGQMHKTSIGARFMVTSKKCSAKPLSDIQNVQNEVWLKLFSFRL